MFGMIAGSENGLTRSGPRSISVSQQSSKDFRPPIAVATEAPTRSDSFSISIPESDLRLPRRRDDQLREAVHPPRLPVLDPPGWVELLRLAGEPDREPTRIKGT